MIILARMAMPDAMLNAYHCALSCATAKLKVSGFRPLHENVMATGRGHFQRAFDVLLPIDANTIVPVTHLLSPDPGVTMNSFDG